ncbi:MAG: hypothetical protein WC780_00675 [Lentimicrobiaceae bacterium]|jgi:hypothetical protein
MRASLFLIWAVLLVLICQTVDAQKVLLLQKPGKTKRFLYYTGDKIIIRTGDPEFEVRGEITYIDDSIVTVNKNYTYQLAKVKEVIIKRPFLNGSWRMMYLTSGIYAAGSIFNRAINNNKPLVDNTIPVVSGSFIALGTASYLLRNKHCKIEDGWKLKVLDFDIYKENYKPKE